SIPLNKELIFIGVSFGGILAQEISKIIPVKKIILISTIKSAAEKPKYFSWVQMFPVYKIIPTILIKYLAIFISKFFTNKNNEERQLFKSMLMQANSRVIRYGIHEVLHWKQQHPIANCIHIHGSADHIFPIKKIKTDYVIDSGSHFMIIHQRKEINALINQLLGKII
ncbi:MAG: alpha/beta hydrolase, partial [Chitinophagales bacterium]|nr:alpha/beta hydrolase [Chitinophagales bacterium]